MAEQLLIVAIEAIAAVIFIATLVFSWKIFSQTKKTTDLWLFISFAVFMLFLSSALNAFEWYFSENTLLDTFGEYSSVIFSIVWIYITHKFMRMTTES